jgi:hypothetical protein
MVESSGSSRSAGSCLSTATRSLSTMRRAQCGSDRVIRDAEPLAHARCGVSCTGGVETADARDGWVCPSLQIVTVSNAQYANADSITDRSTIFAARPRSDPGNSMRPRRSRSRSGESRRSGSSPSTARRGPWKGPIGEVSPVVFVTSWRHMLARANSLPRASQSPWVPPVARRN